MAQQQERAYNPQEFVPECRSRRYEGCVAVVTGSAQGMGRVIARWLAQEGARVVIADIQEERGRKTADELQGQTGMEFLYCGGDLSVPGVADEMVARTLTEFGQIDTLVNVAAFQARLPLVDFPEHLMQKSVNWNLWNTVRTCKAVLPHMMERRYGRIVNIGGAAFENGNPFHTFLAGLGKGGIVGLTTTLAGETVTYGITVNCVSPGGIHTQWDGTPDSIAGGREPEINATEEMQQRYPSPGGGFFRGVRVHPEAVAAAVAFLGAPESFWVTGQLLGVNGGSSMLL